MVIFGISHPEHYPYTFLTFSLLLYLPSPQKSIVFSAPIGPEHPLSHTHPPVLARDLTLDEYPLSKGNVCPHKSIQRIESSQDEPPVPPGLATLEENPTEPWSSPQFHALSRCQPGRSRLQGGRGFRRLQAHPRRFRKYSWPGRRLSLCPSQTP